MKYILAYLREEMFIEPVAGVTVDVIDEDIAPDTPIGHRLVLNGKETDIVVWFADYDAWLEKKYDNLQNDYNKLMRMLPTPEPELDNQISASEVMETLWDKND